MTAVDGPSLRTRALGYLARREHSRLELQRKLAPHAPTPQELSSVLDALEERGFLSATRAMEQIVHMRKNRFGSLKIVHELREKGIEENLIADILPNLRETERKSAQEVWRKKFGVMPANAKEFGRQMRFLAARGFPAEVVRQLLRDSGKDDA
jgi:regulatory protein